MEHTVESCQSIVVNAELRKLVDRFIKETVSTNKLPWYMVESALEHSLAWVHEKAIEEIDEAQNLMSYLSQPNPELAPEEQEEE